MLALGKIGKPAVDPLIQALIDEDAYVGMYAATYLRNWILKLFNNLFFKIF